MIGYLRGEVLDHVDGKMILSVADVGYQVTVPAGPNYLGFTAGNRVELFIHTHVREDALELFGFATRFEKDVFLTLLTVNGIGPRGAMGILSNIESEELISAILDGDRERLTKIPGVGKKTAERVVLELADPLRKKQEAGLFGSASTRASVGSAARDTMALPRSKNQVVSDARSALVGLGYRDADVTTLLNRVIAESETPPTGAEELIRTALRQLAI